MGERWWSVLCLITYQITNAMTNEISLALQLCVSRLLFIRFFD